MTFGYLLSLLVVSAVLTAEANTDAPTGARSVTTGKIQNQKKGGVRFLLRNKEQDFSKNMVAQIDEKTFLPVKFSSSVPGPRIPFPKNGILRIYDEKPQKGKPSTPLYSQPIPMDQGQWLLGIVSDLGDQIRIDYISEQELKPGRVLLMNLTRKPFLMNVKNIQGELNQIPLNPETKYVFGKNQRVENISISFPAQLMHQADTKMGKIWITERKLQLICYERQSSVFIIIPNKSNTGAMVYSTSFYLDN